MGLFSGNAPTYNQPGLPSSTDALVGNTVNNQALGTQQQYANAALAGTTNSGNMVSNIGANASNSNMSEGGGGMPGMAQAIQNKQAKNYNIAQGQLGTQANLWGANTQMSRTTQAAQNINQLSNLEWGVSNFSNQADIATQSARNAVVGGIFQGAGALGGAAAAGAFSGPTNSGPGTNFQSTMSGMTSLEGAQGTYGAPSTSGIISNATQSPGIL